MPYQEGSPGSYHMCLSLGGFRLAWIKRACEWMLLTTVAEMSWLAGWPSETFIYFFRMRVHRW